VFHFEWREWQPGGRLPCRAGLPVVFFALCHRAVAVAPPTWVPDP
jgi:hypothetical protein